MILAALAAALDENAGIEWYEVKAADVATVALAIGCTAHDGAYVWLAGSLGAGLITEDGRLANVTAVAAA